MIPFACHESDIAGSSNGYCAQAAECTTITTIIKRKVNKFSSRVKFYCNVKQHYYNKPIPRVCCSHHNRYRLATLRTVGNSQI